jgi:hypothetical protein
MPSGTVELSLRPLKLAFVVNPSDAKALLAALELNSFLWGGAYNPIVPRFGKIPGAWRRRFPRSFTPAEIVRGYVSAFDPDIIITFNEKDAKTLSSLGRMVVHHTEILDRFEDDYTVKYAVGLPEILRHFAHEELRFQRRKPVKMTFPQARGSLALLCASVFGRLPPSAKKDFDAGFAEHCGITYEKMSVQNFSEYLDAGNLFPRRITQFHIDSTPRKARFINRCLFFFDGESALDILDYWNLRALGLTVVPVPQQAATEPGMRDYALDFIHESFAPYRHNPDMFHHATLIPSSCCAPRLFLDFVGALQTTHREHKHGMPELNIQPWYPRIWDDWGRQSDGFDCASFRTKTAKHSLQTLDGSISLPQVEPKFVSRFGGHGKPRFANEVEFRLYGGADLFAEIIPEADDGMVRAIGGYGFRDWRFSNAGPVYLASHTDWSLTFSCPKAETVFSEWLRSRGWTSTLSTSGKIAMQMAKQLGGTWGISLLAHDGLVDFLCGLAGGKPISETELRKQLNIIAQREKYGGDADRLLKTLIDVKALSLGLEIQCPTCSIRSWFSVKDVDYEVVCPNCFASFRIPCHSPSEMKWSYRALGPFNLPKASFGAYCVLLTLAFFSRSLHGATTPMLSFDATKGESKLEADLGMFFTKSVFAEERPLLIFAECKTHMRFKEVDFSRMAKLSREFPGALIVFATLNKELSPGERSRIRALSYRARKRRLKGKPFSEVLVLTANELTSTFGPTDKWEALSDKHKSLRDFASRDLEHLAEATQQIYLDMESWHQWFQQNRPIEPPPPARVTPTKEPQASAEASASPKMYLRVSTRMREVRAIDVLGGTD